MEDGELLVDGCSTGDCLEIPIIAAAWSVAEAAIAWVVDTLVEEGPVVDETLK